MNKVLIVIKFDQKSWLKTCIYMNTKLKRKAKNEFEKHFFKLMHNSVFGKTMGNVRKLKNNNRKIIETV